MKRAALAALALLAAGVLVWYLFRTEELTSVAVLPLENASADPAESDYLADGITRAVITRLSQVGIRVPPWESVRRYRGPELEPRAIARELNVDAVLLGTFQQEGDRILATLTLMEADSGFIAWSEELEEPYEGLFQVQRRIAQGAAASLNRSLSGEEEELLSTDESKSIEAYDLYLQGAHLMQAGDRESTEIAFEYFSRAAELDPNLVGAHLGLGAVHNMRYFHGWGSGPSSLARAEASYQRALALDPSSLVARRGLVMFHFFKGETESILEHGRRAAEAGRPDDPETLLTRALADHYGGLTSLSLDLYRRVLEIDPGHQEARYQFVSALLWSGEPERAREAGNEFLRRFGDDSDIHGHLGAAYGILGDEERAREHYSKATSGEPHPWVSLWAGLFVQGHGDRDRAVELWQRAAASVESNLSIHPDHEGMRSFLAAFRSLASGDRAAFEKAKTSYKTTGIYGWELEAVFAAPFGLNDEDGAIELLRTAVEHGRLLLFWDTNLANASLTLPPSDALRELRKEHEALKARYLDRYGTGR